MTFFVTGVGGQLGHDVLNELSRRGHQGIGSDIAPEYRGVQDGSPAVAMPYVSLNITDGEAVRRVLTDHRPDAVVHCAAWTAVDAAEEEENRPKVTAVNVLGTENIAKVCGELGIKMLYISTDYVFDGQGETPWEEDSTDYAPLNFYGKSKLEGEQAVRQWADKHYIVRTAWVFGRNGNNFIRTMLRLSETHDSLRVVNDQVGTPTYTVDLARLLVDMGERDAYGTYHATNEGGFISWYDFACAIFRQAGKKVTVTPVSTAEYGLSKAVRPFNSRLSKEKLRQNGFEPLPTWENALKRYLSELQAEETASPSVTPVDVYLVGSKSIGQYGGYESFVQKLLTYHEKNTAIRYHVACKENGDGHMDVTKLPGASAVENGRFTYCGADCFMLPIPTKLGPAQAIYYDCQAMKASIRHIRENKVQNPIVYIMACRIGPFMKHYVRQIHRLGGKVYLNPDGHEWKRAKWSAPVRKYWKESERMMVKEADLCICDSINIEKYIKTEYASYQPKTTFIAYGAEIKESPLPDDAPKYTEWIEKHGLSNGYYTVVGRCVPENNFETIVREFMKSHSKRDLAIITTDNPKMRQDLEDRLHYSQDKRIKFVGTVYDSELLQKIRENSCGYFHGHSVGGTNPSLLEALGSTKVNLLYDIGFNKEVGEDAALYWSLEDGDLAALIDRADALTGEEIDALGTKAKQRIRDAYSWQFICDRYAATFLGG